MDGFLTRNINYRNSMNPYIFGSIVAEGTGSRVHFELQPMPIFRILPLPFLLVFVLSLLSIPVQFFHHEPVLPVVAATAGLAGIAAFLAGFGWLGLFLEIGTIQKFMKETLMGEI